MGFFSSIFNPKNPEQVSKTTKQIIIDKYYSDYPVIPYISDERSSDWIERAEMFPKQSIISKSTMTRYPDGLLPGHIYMLYWLEKYTNKIVPEYFEYRYGIDFNKEKQFLALRGYLACDKPTIKGKEAIKNHYEIIEERHPTPVYKGASSTTIPSITSSGRIIPNKMQEGDMLIPIEDRITIGTEFENINKMISFALKLSGLKNQLKIEPSKFAYGIGSTYYESHPTTPSGRPAKYPLTLIYKYNDHDVIIPAHDYFGEINYLQDGSIGSARLIFWNKRNGYMIHLGIIDKKLSVKKVEKSIDSKWMTLYKF